MSSAETTDSETEEAPLTDPEREAFVAEFTERLGADAVVAHHIDPTDDVWVRVTAQSWDNAAFVLRSEMGFDYFTYVSAIDWMPSPYGRRHDSNVDLILTGAAGDSDEAADEMTRGKTGGETRFQVFARVHSTTKHMGVTLKVDVDEETLTVPTWVGVYPGANWHEREVWEMFGISFDGHPNLRHLYLPSDFEGNPMRKDFPLLARHMKPWPGIVDVEPMPGEDAEDGAGEGD